MTDLIKPGFIEAMKKNLSERTGMNKDLSASAEAVPHFSGISVEKLVPAAVAREYEKMAPGAGAELLRTYQKQIDQEYDFKRKNLTYFYIDRWLGKLALTGLVLFFILSGIVLALAGAVKIGVSIAVLPFFIQLLRMLLGRS